MGYYQRRDRNTGDAIVAVLARRRALADEQAERSVFDDS